MIEDWLGPPIGHWAALGPRMTLSVKPLPSRVSARFWRFVTPQATRTRGNRPIGQRRQRAGGIPAKLNSSSSMQGSSPNPPYSKDISMVLNSLSLSSSTVPIACPSLRLGKIDMAR